MQKIQWIKLKALLNYQEGLTLMEQVLNEVIEKNTPGNVLLIEHEEVYTAGTSAKAEELLVNPSLMNIPVYDSIGRGGKYTFHGPGQRIIYPIINLRTRDRDLHKYVRDLELSIIETLKFFNIEGFIIHGKIGVWVMKNNQPAKIAAIGIRVKKWVTYHGIAVNISTDLSKFNNIIPCGLKDDTVTSILDLGVKIDFEEFDEIFIQNFEKIFHQ